MSSTTNRASKWFTMKTFAFGFVTGIVCLRAVRVYQTWCLPSAKKIQLAILPMLRANNEIRRNIGSSLKPGLLSAYAYRGGLKWRLPYLGKGSSWLSIIPFFYKPWSISMLFQVIGNKETGLVSLETLPASDRTHGETVGIKSVLVDFKDGQRLVLRGNVTQSGESVEYEHISD